MEPDDDLSSLRGDFGEAARLVESLGYLTLAGFALAAAAVTVLRYGDALWGFLDLALAGTGDPRRLSPRRFARRPAIRRTVAFAVAVGTLFAGVTGGVLQLDAGRRDRGGRFWSVPPSVIAGILWVWSECRVRRPCPPEVIAFARDQDLGTWHGRLIARMVSRVLMSNFQDGMDWIPRRVTG